MWVFGGPLPVGLLERARNDESPRVHGSEGRRRGSAARAASSDVQTSYSPGGSGARLPVAGSFKKEF